MIREEFQNLGPIKCVEVELLGVARGLGTGLSEELPPGLTFIPLEAVPGEFQDQWPGSLEMGGRGVACSQPLALVLG